jgi:hypothetical protein
MSLRRRLAIGLLVALVYSLTMYATSHASEPQEPIDKSAAVMIVMTVLITLHRLFF